MSERKNKQNIGMSLSAAFIANSDNRTCIENGRDHVTKKGPQYCIDRRGSENNNKKDKRAKHNDKTTSENWMFRSFVSPC